MSRTKEETLLLEERIEKIRKRNEELKRRHLEVEADKQNAAKLNALVQMTSPTEHWPIGRRSSPDNNGRSRFRYSEPNRSQQSNSGLDSSAKYDTFGERDSAPHDSDRSFSQRHHRNHYERQEQLQQHQQQQLQQQQQYKQQHQQQPQWSRKSRGRSRGAFTRERDRKHSLRPIGGRGVPEPEYDAWRAERNQIDSDRISRQRTAEGHWRREWDNEKLTQEEDMREAVSVTRGGGPRRTTMVQNSYGDHRAHTEDCVRSGEDSSFRSSRVPGSVRGGHGISRGCRGNTRGSRHVDAFPNLDSREESAAAAHSGRSVISTGESLKISVLNDSATSVRRVRVNAPGVAGTGRVGPQQMLRVSYSSQSEDEAPSRRVELQPNRNLSNKDKACSDSCSPSVSAVSKPPLPPSAGVKLDSEPKTQRVKRLGQDSKVKNREKKDVSVAEICKCIHKKEKEEAAVLTLACCPKETESGGEDSWEDITTSGNDSACEELSPHSNTDTIMDITSTNVKSKMPENMGEMPQNTEMKSEMLQNTEPKSEVLQNTEAKTEKLLNKEIESEMLQSSDFKSEALQNTEVKTEKLLNKEMKSEMHQNAVPKLEVLQNTEAKAEKLLNTEMKSEMHQNAEPESEVLQNTEAKAEKLPNTEMKSEMHQNAQPKSEVLQNAEPKSEVLLSTEMKSEMMMNTEPQSEVLQNTDVKPEVLHNIEVKVGILQNEEMKPEILHIPEVKPDVLQRTDMNSEVLQNTEVRSEMLPTVRSIPNNDLDGSTEVTKIGLNKNVPDAIMQDTEKRCVSDGSTEYAELKDVSGICLEKSHSDILVQRKAETVNETTELTEIENVSLMTECKEERLESEIKIEREERCGQNEELGKEDVTEILGSVAASSVHEEKQGPV